MRRVLAIVVIVGFSGQLSAQEKYESKEGRYSIAFPGTPTVENKKADDGEANIAIATKGAGAFVVSYSDLPPDAVKDGKPADVLGKTQLGLVKQFGAKVTEAKDIEFGTSKHPARRLTAEKDKMHIRVLIVLVDNRVYQALVLGPKELVNGKDADEFFKSFAITK